MQKRTFSLHLTRRPMPCVSGVGAADGKVRTAWEVIRNPWKAYFGKLRGKSGDVPDSTECKAVICVAIKKPSPFLAETDTAVNKLRLGKARGKCCR